MTRPAAPTMPDLSATICSTMGTSRPSSPRERAQTSSCRGISRSVAGVGYAAAEDDDFRVEEVEQSGERGGEFENRARDDGAARRRRLRCAAWKTVRQVASWGCSRKRRVSTESQPR